VCRHAQNDLHTTTNILLTPLASQCTKPFSPFDPNTNTPATAECRSSDITLAEFKTLPMFSGEGGEGQDKRAAGRFALIGLAGELATEYGLTVWKYGDAIQAAAEGFKLWCSMRGTGNDERRQIAERMSGFLERHGDGRFSNKDYDGDESIKDRAGWWRNTTDGREYLLTSEAMREATKGFDLKRALDVLKELGALQNPGADGKRSKPLRIGGRTIRLYAINPDKLTVSDHGA
jgi:putative DNA primase/helicase